jgi:hypothetical protein
MELPPGVSWVTNCELAQVREKALSNGATVFDLEPAATTREAIFEAVRSSMPLDPPIISSRSWDALSDSVWGGLHALDSRNILITWARASEFRDAAPAEFDITSGILSGVAEQLLSWEVTYGEPKRVTVVFA